MTLQKGMSEKDKRMLKAAKKRWRENKDLQTVASELNLSYSTVRQYFASDDMQRFERYYSESDKQLLDAQLEQMVEDGTNTALQLHSQVQSRPDVKPRVLVKAMKEAQKIPERHIKMLQELGIKEKPKERKQVEQSMDTSDVRDELSEIYKQKQEGQEDESKEQGVEAQ